MHLLLCFGLLLAGSLGMRNVLHPLSRHLLALLQEASKIEVVVTRGQQDRGKCVSRGQQDWGKCVTKGQQHGGKWCKPKENSLKFLSTIAAPIYFTHVLDSYPPFVYPMHSRGQKTSPRGGCGGDGTRTLDAVHEALLLSLTCKSSLRAVMQGA